MNPAAVVERSSYGDWSALAWRSGGPRRLVEPLRRDVQRATANAAAGRATVLEEAMDAVRRLPAT